MDAHISPDPKAHLLKEEINKQREMQERKQGFVEEIAPKAQTPFALDC